MSAPSPSPGVDKSYGIEPDEVSSHQEGPPLAWFCGAARIPATWITTCGEWIGMGGDKGKVWAVDIVAALACGRVDGVLRVFKDDQVHHYEQYRMPTGSDARFVRTSPAGYNGAKDLSYIRFENHIRLHWGVSTPQRSDRLFPGPEIDKFHGDWDPGQLAIEGAALIPQSPVLPTASADWVGHSYRLTRSITQPLLAVSRQIPVLPAAGDIIICQAAGWDPKQIWSGSPYCWFVMRGSRGEMHPDYANICFAEIDGWPLGARGRKQLPNLEFILVRAPQLPAWATGFPDPYIADVATQGYRLKYTTACNPVTCLLELLTHPVWGMGMQETEFSLDSWRTVAAAVDGIEFAIAPKLTSQDDIESVTDDILGYFDGYLYRDGAGKLCIGHYAAGGVAVDPATLPQISEHDLVEPPEITTVTPSECINELTLEYTDGRWPEYKFKSRSITMVATQTRLQRGTPVRENIERPWITNEWQAQQYAATALQQLAAQRMSGELTVRRARAQRSGGGDLAVGDMFVLDYGPLELDIVCRITEQSIPFDGSTLLLKWESERGQFPLPYVAPLESAPQLALPPVEQLDAEQSVVIYPLHRILDTGNLHMVVLAARRSQRGMIGGDVWVSTTGTTYSAAAVAPIAMSLKASLVADISAAQNSIRLDAPSPDVGMLQEQAALEAADDTLLLIVRDEIMSIGTVAPVAGEPTQFDLTVLRGRLLTGAAAQSRLSGADPVPVWIIYRSELEAAIAAHPEMQEWGAERWVKIRPRNTYQSAALGDPQTLAMNITLPTRATFFPPVTALAVQIVGRLLSVTWTMPSPAGRSDWLMIEYGRAATSGGVSGQPNRIWLKTSEQLTAAAPVVLPTTGWYWVRMWSMRAGIYSQPTDTQWIECAPPSAPTYLTPILGPDVDAALQLGEVVLPWNTVALTDQDRVVCEYRAAGQTSYQSVTVRATAAAAILRLPRSGVWYYRLSVIDRDGQTGPPGAEASVTVAYPTPAGLTGAYSNGQARLAWTEVPASFPVYATVETDYGTGTNWYTIGGTGTHVFASPQGTGLSWKYRIGYPGTTKPEITVYS